MSLEKIIKSLVEMGFKRVQAEVYVYLAKKGPKTIEDLTQVHIFSEKEIRTSLNFLQRKGLMTQNQMVYSALPFEEALNLLIQKQKEDQESFEKLKNELNF